LELGRGIAQRHAVLLCGGLTIGMGLARNAILARTADGVVALGGGLGTLSEIALALGNRRPTVGIKTWRFDRQGRTEPALPVAANPIEALDCLFAHMGRPS
jgi:hypothetical protein